MANVECFPLTRATLLRVAERKSEFGKRCIYVVTRGRQGNSQFEHHFRADTVRLVSSRNESEMSVNAI